MSRDDRAQFAQEILATLDGSAEADVGELWQAEIERRAEEVLAGRAELEDADAVHARIAAQLRDRSK